MNTDIYRAFTSAHEVQGFALYAAPRFSDNSPIRLALNDVSASVNITK